MSGKESSPVAVFSGAKSDLRGFGVKILTGSAQGILIGVLPSAVMRYILQYSGLLQTHAGANFNAILNLFMVFIPFLIGMAIAFQFKMNALSTGVIGIAVAASSGSIRWIAVHSYLSPIAKAAKSAPLTGTFYQAQGAGDVINAMAVSAIAVLVTWLVARYLKGFGSVAIILGPILIGGGVGLIGTMIAPYVADITTWIGDIVRWAFDQQPFIMAPLVAALFAMIIVTPVSTVGIALAINLNQMGSGAAAMGVVATTVVLMINSWFVNKKGVTVAIFLGAMKGMMPSVFKKPITLIAFALSGAISGLTVALFNIQGTATTAGFGWIGMVSPIQSFVNNNAEKADTANYISNYINPFLALIVWFVVPVIVGFLVDFLFRKVLKLYRAADFQQEL
ncbi:PTS sugar transporter subunit IIC [Oenococcus kitaharae]|uniref:Membrane protein n=1 Tax=Oenococcus kitaharae DSM 17330 TaxID=1045004 RepID=G9WID7_9LACO|nr:PTS sugar transporter subunit IIC [Oenococcus kitaharae]EHN58949.1 Membrane protein [Oenococcus kitaharae DSM 17330]OEY81736.1 membrane protein [Oenococcus kitaharae]OEY83967.1 membrane protein [Oenococcus kitaharae]OEY85677.1 membrane protein [Oenococcus kitaharae]